MSMIRHRGGSRCPTVPVRELWARASIRMRSIQRRTLVKNLFAVVVLAMAWMVCGERAKAQTPPPSGDQHVVSSQDLDLLRQDLRSMRKQLIAQNLKLTDTEATKFWPVYDKYTAELVKINDKKYALIQSYADQCPTMSDEQALPLAGRWAEMDTA